MTPLEAVRSAYKKHPVMEVMRDELVDVLVAEAQRGGAADVEKKKLKAAMAKAWAEDGLTLSERTTHGRRWVVEQATKTIEAAIKKGGSVMTLAKELFDGYGHDHVIPKQEIQKFMGKLVALSKDYQGNAFKRALRDAQRNIDKLSTQGLKAAYNGIIDAISKGNEEMVDKAIYVATQEKARYFAERIARTEKARAYMDGVMYKYANDPDCIAFKWKLSSRHPCDDICDLYARADLWGMGEGIFPKDKLPKLPVHPNCMCRVVPIFHGSTRVTSETPKDKTLAGGLAYIMILTEMQRHSLLGVNGAKEVQNGASWKQYARGYSDEVMESRLEVVQEYKTPEYGRMEYAGLYNGKMLMTRPVLNSQYNIFVSEKLVPKPKMIHEMERQLSESTKIIGVKDIEDLPKIIIERANQMGNRLGSFSAAANRLIINELVLDSQWAARYSGMQGSLKAKKLTTIIHELFHWKDARWYIRKYGTILDNEKYIEKLCELYRGKVADLIKSGYNIDEISMYAAQMRALGRYDEVMTEYRTHEVLKGR